MKKLSIAVVLMAASVTFAHAQITDSAKTVQPDTTVNTNMNNDTTVVTPKVKDPNTGVMKADETAVKTQTPAEMKQKARMEKKAKKAEME